MELAKRLGFVAALIGSLVLSGCSPSVVCSVETVVLPDYTCRRVLRLDATPHPNYPNQRPRLGDYFQFPPPKQYETYLTQPEKAVFAGIFESFESIPRDVARITPGSDKIAGNSFSFRVMDLVLVVLADFDESINDIIASREDGQAALGELIRLVVPELMAVLNARYGTKYDLSRLELWLQNDLVSKVQRIYGGAWDIRSSKRSGVTSPGEMFELYYFIKEEARREGLELADIGTPDLEQENIRRLKEFGAQKARELCPPRQPGGTPLSPDMLSGKVGDDLLGALQKTVTARHGSINEFIRRIGLLLPRSFGAYLVGDAMPLYMIPDVTYHYRLKVPGIILQTNGLRDVSGEVLWNFADTDLALTGQSMWARTLFIREPVLHALGIQGFPSSLTDVDQLFGFSVNPAGLPRDNMLIALQQSAMERNFGPLEALANDPAHPDSQAAKGVLELLNKFRRQGGAAGAPPPAPPQPSQPAPTAPRPIQPPAPQAAQAAPAPAPAPAAPAPVPTPTAPVPRVAPVQSAPATRSNEINDALTPLQPIAPPPIPSAQGGQGTGGNNQPVSPPALPPPVR